LSAGTPRDTLELRQKIADSNDRLKLSAKGIGERLKAAVTANSTPQTQKILSNFQVRDGQARISCGKAPITEHQQLAPMTQACVLVPMALCTVDRS
jgi:hypothetical protein